MIRYTCANLDKVCSELVTASKTRVRGNPAVELDASDKPNTCPQSTPRTLQEEEQNFGKI